MIANMQMTPMRKSISSEVSPIGCFGLRLFFRFTICVGFNWLTFTMPLPPASEAWALGPR